MKRLLITIVVIVTEITACRDRLPDSFTIQGRVAGLNGKWLYLAEMNVDGVKRLDSVAPDASGTFLFRQKTQIPGFYLLEASGGRHLLLVVGLKETVKVDVNLEKEPPAYTVSGSPGSELVKSFLDHADKNLRTADSLNAILKKMEGTPAFYPLSVSFDSLFMALLTDQQRFGREMILENSGSLASLVILDYRFGDRLAIDPAENRDLYTLLDTTLSKKYPSSPHVLFHHQRLESLRRQGMERER